LGKIEDRHSYGPAAGPVPSWEVDGAAGLKCRVGFHGPLTIAPGNGADRQQVV